MGISIWQLLIVLIIVVLLFGTKRLRNLGGDLGSAIRSFRSAVKEGEDGAENAGDKLENKAGETIDAEEATPAAKEEKKV